MKDTAEASLPSAVSTSPMGARNSSKIVDSDEKFGKSNRPSLSIVIPCRNEASFISQCLDSLLNNGFPRSELEILVVDGMSNDCTREIVKRYSIAHPIRLLDNPQRVTPYALNIGIRAARGEIIMRVDAHAFCAPQYIATCVNALKTYQADDVGGVWRIRTRTDTLIGRSIAEAVSNRFGVGNLRYRTAPPRGPVEVETVPFFCCRREIFDRVGLFNERLTRIQDQEFNARLRCAGGKILLVPEAVSYYMVRSDLRSFWRHNWDDGVWSMLAFAHSDVMPICFRHLAPPAFAITLALSAMMALLGITAWPVLLVGGMYVFAALCVALSVAIGKKDCRYMLTLPTIFAVLHVGRGFGSVWGMLRLLSQRRLGHAVRLLAGDWKNASKSANS